MNKPTRPVSPPAVPSAASLSPDDIQRIAERAKAQARQLLQKIPVLGAVTWLMMQQPTTRHTVISELEWRVMPALALDQAKLYMREEAPLAFVSWARLSPAAAERYAGAPHQLSPGDWKSGTQNWVIDLITPFGGASEVLDDLRRQVFAGQALHQLVPDAGDGVRTMVWEPLDATSTPDTPNPGTEKPV